MVIPTKWPLRKFISLCPHPSLIGLHSALPHSYLFTRRLHLVVLRGNFWWWSGDHMWCQGLAMYKAKALLTVLTLALCCLTLIWLEPSWHIALLLNSNQLDAAWAWLNWQISAHRLQSKNPLGQVTEEASVSLGRVVPLLKALWVPSVISCCFSTEQTGSLMCLHVLRSV